MSMLGVMSGAVNGGAGFVRLRRHVYSGVDNADVSPDVQIVRPLDDFLAGIALARPSFPFPSCL